MEKVRVCPINEQMSHLKHIPQKKLKLCTLAEWGADQMVGMS